MISEGIIKSEYVRQILKRDSDYIRSVQAKVIQEANLIKSGMLSYDIRGQSAAKILQGEGIHLLTVTFLKYLRFIDIKSNRKKATRHIKINVGTHYERKHKEMPLRRNLALYNRVVFGRLYNETKTDLKAGYTEEIKTKIRKDLENAGFK